jgi:acetyl esterase/lipase
MADAKSAVRWLRAHAGELGVDPNRVVAGGGSSGGHLALSSAILEGFDEPEEDRRTSSKPNVLVLFNPVVDTSRSQRMGARALEGSPYHNVSRDLPPTVIFHGRADTTVPYAHVERYCAKAQELGNRCELFGYEGAEHGFFSPRVEEGRWYRETLVEADRFLTTLGYLPAPAPIKIP